MPDLAHPISFPSPTWDGESPDNVHATICALRSLDALLPTNAVVCSGEDTHGVSQSSRLHSLIARYLVLHSGARTIVLEDMDADVAFAQAFVRTGDASQLAKYFGSTGPSLAAVAEVEELLGELHAISDALPNGEQLSIRGMDVAVQVNGTLDRLTGYYQRVNAPNATALTKIAPRGSATGVVARLQPAAMFVDGLATDLVSNKATYVAMTDADSWELADEDAANLRDGYLFLSRYYQQDFAGGDAMYREPGLARNLERLAGAASGPILVIAHNQHCAKANDIGGSYTVGTIVAQPQHLGARFFVIAQAYGGGTQLYLDSTTAALFATMTVDHGTLGPALARVSPADAFLLATTSSDFAMTKSWVGEYMDTLVPSADFNALAFVRAVTPTTPRK